MKKVKLLLLAMTIICISNFLGCAMLSPTKTGETPSLEPQSISKFSDIPVPVGVKILPADSYAFESAGVRVGVLKYRGRVDADRVTVFYREQMPMYNWNTLNIVEYGQRMLNFDRETETCVITMDQQGKTLTITISVGPKSQTSRRTARPVK